jgi:ornithine cyclodeaminase/alanine dehydrogenase-like protein (mu-crystallin family)
MTKNASIPYLSHEILVGLGITTADVIEAIETMIRGSAAGIVWSAPKAVLVPPDGRYMMAALAAADEPALLAVKTVVMNPRNTTRGLPQINGLVSLLDSETGVPVAIVDGNWVTAVRTAGLSAVAAKYMANPDASVAGFVGTGVQARSHLTAFAEMFPLKRIKIFGRGQANIDLLAAHARDLGLDAQICTSGPAAIQDADIVVTSITATSDGSPFLDARDLAPGAFAAGTDLGVPWIRESFAVIDRLVVDDLRQEEALPNKLADPAHVHGDLTGLVTGKITGRDQASDRTAFIFRGHALGDLALSALAYSKFSGN